MIVSIAMALALAAAPTPEAAPADNGSAPTTEAAPAAAPAKAEKPKLICRRGQPTNSLVPTRKICLTAEQWAKRAGAVTGKAD